jgi:hypothetical protein
MNDDLDMRFDDIGDPFGDVGAGAAAPAAPSAADAKAIAQAAGPSPARPRVRAMRFAALGAAIAYDGAWVLHERRPDLGAESPATVALHLGIPLVAAMLALAAATRKGPRGLGLRAATIAALAIGAPAVFAIATWLAAPGASDGGPFWPRALRCLGATAVLSIGPLGLGLWAFRRAFVAAARWRTAAVGVACGALAAATMSISCSVDSALHVLVGHGTMMAVAALAGAGLARALAR